MLTKYLVDKLPDVEHKNEVSNLELDWTTD